MTTAGCPSRGAPTLHSCSILAPSSLALRMFHSTNTFCLVRRYCSLFTPSRACSMPFSALELCNGADGAHLVRLPEQAVRPASSRWWVPLQISSSAMLSFCSLRSCRVVLGFEQGRRAEMHHALPANCSQVRL